MTHDQIMAALKAVAPALSPGELQNWATELEAPLAQAEINTPHRLAMFLGHASFESGGFRSLIENLNYTAERLTQVWPSRFPDIQAALPYAQNPPRLANQVYANRLGNGPSATGDGWTFRGRGLFQLTGRSTYAEFAQAVGQPLAVATSWCSTKPGAAASACWFWEEHDLNALADNWQITASTKVITGSISGAQTRIRLCNAALDALALLQPPIVPPKPAPAPVVEPRPAVTADDLNLQELERILAAGKSAKLPEIRETAGNPRNRDNSSDELNQAEIDKIERE